MPTSRCTFLMLKGIYNKFSEIWISDQPFLVLTYVYHYMPWVGRQLMTKIFGPARVRSLIEGLDIYDVKVK